MTPLSRGHALVPGQHVSRLRPVEAALQSGDHALNQAGDLIAARQHFQRAAELADAAGDVDALGRAVLGWSGMWVHENRGTREALRVRLWRQRALARVPGDSLTGLRLAARVAAEEDYIRGTHARVDHALDVARASGSALLHAETLSLTHHCLLGCEHGQRRLELADELIGLGLTVGRNVDTRIGVLWRTVDLFLAGDPHAERCLDELRQLSAVGPHLATRYLVSALDVMLTIRAGRLAEAEQLAAECLALGERSGDVDAAGWYGAQLCAIRWYQGRASELTSLLETLVSSATMSATNEAYWAAMAVCAAQGKDRDRAERALGRLQGRGLSQLRSSSTWLVSLLGVAESAYLLGNPATAAQAYALLEPFADLPVMASLGIACFGSAHYALARAALACGDLTRAVDHLNQGRTHNLTLGNIPATRQCEALLAELRTPDTRQSSVSCRRQGEAWVVSVGERRVLVKECVGMHHLATLVASPGRQMRASELAGLAVTHSSQQPVLDRRALHAYRTRLAELRQAEDDALYRGQESAARAAREEYDAIAAELARGSGLAGRSRDFASVEERARTSVQKAIKRALTMIHDADAAVAEALESRLMTGQYCCFRD